MPRPFAVGKIEVGLSAGEETSPPRPEPDTPFCVALLGDFSGRARRDPAGSRLLAVDRDNLDEVLAGLGVELSLPGAGPDSRPVSVRFAGLADFEPDRLLERVEAFRQLRDLRRRLGNRATFAEAAAEVRGWLRGPTTPEPRTAPEPAPADPDNLLEQVLQQSSPPSRRVEPFPGGGDWQAILQRLVAPHVAAPAGPEQAGLEAAVDAVLAEGLRAVLHHSAFRALEAAWRGVEFLVRRLETGPQLRLCLLDVAKEELAADLAGDDLRSTATYRRLAAPPPAVPESRSWAILVGNYTFGPEQADVELLGRLGRLARGAGAPFLAAAGSRVLGCASLAEAPEPDNLPASPDAEAWEALRAAPEAQYLGLALPRFLLRLPYGPGSQPVEQLAFEEMTPAAPHEAYLWGNPAFACAYLLGETFNRRGWAMRPGDLLDIDGLPLHVPEGDGGSQVKPCAEVVLSDRAVRALLDRGLMPLRSVRDRDAVHLAAFQSLAGPGQPLRGPWGA
jgi:type VI secretion system protein ImpC